jgi:hypothetical protein
MKKEDEKYKTKYIGDINIPLDEDEGYQGFKSHIKNLIFFIFYLKKEVNEK